jgi:DNA-binding transcriptional ArsR family regulator
MLLRRAELDAIKAGEIDLAFRRWERPRLNAGTKMRTAIGLVEVTAVQRIAPSRISERQARRAGAATRAELLARLDRRNEAQPVYRVGLRFAGADPRIALREHADLSDAELAQITARLQRLDRARDGKPWTRTLLELIDRQPATLAAELAEHAGRELPAFKRDVRKLKELGLTESLERGYRLSPRGRAVLERTAL